MTDELKPVAELNDEDLLQNCVELYGRSVQNPNSEKTHNRSVELKDEVARRLALRHEQRTEQGWVSIEKFREELLGALARGYCSKENEHKELDGILIEAMVKEVLTLTGGMGDENI